jgi:hypothetical protein
MPRQLQEGKIACRSLKENQMPASEKTLIDLENRFWQSMVDEDTDAALSLLHEPALMVSSHGSIKFDHAGYRKMAEQGTMVVKSFKLQDVNVIFPDDKTAVLSYQVKQTTAKRGESAGNTETMSDCSTWVKSGRKWQCVLHTETPMATPH